MRRSFGHDIVPASSRPREMRNIRKSGSEPFTRSHQSLQTILDSLSPNLLEHRGSADISLRATQGSDNLRGLNFEKSTLSQLIEDGAKAMTRLTILSAAAILSLTAATPVFAIDPFALQEPGAYAAMHPNANVLNVGWRTPKHVAGAMAFLPPAKSYAHAGQRKR